MLKVFIYWNITRGVWSVKALQGPNRGRVIQHATDITLTDCVFKVSEAGRKKCWLKKSRTSTLVWWDIWIHWLNLMSLVNTLMSPIILTNFRRLLTVLKPNKPCIQPVLLNFTRIALFKRLCNCHEYLICH